MVGLDAGDPAGAQAVVRADYTLSSSATFFHLVNVGIHAANACLIFTLLTRLTTRAVALITALIFALHPVQTEAVTYVTGRSSSLSTLFILLTLSFLSESSWISPDAFRFRDHGEGNGGHGGRSRPS